MGLVAGFCLLVVGAVLLLTDGLVTGALSAAGSGCGGMASSPACGGLLFEYLFLVPGVILVAIGGAILAWSLLAIFRSPRAA